MKSVNNDVIAEAIRIGSDTSKVAEAAQTDLAYKFAEIVVSHPKSDADKEIDKMKEKTNALLNTVLKQFSRVAEEVGETANELFENSKKQAKTLYKIDNDDAIKDYLYKITGDQLLANQKVTYKNGQKIGFKEYTEMATRTRIQHDMLEQQREIGVETRQLFYVCDTYSDCANDHQDYQGQLYYDEKVWKKIPRTNQYYEQLSAAIKKCKASITEVTENKPWLTTRPNCRHRLIPVAIDDVVHLSKKEILKVNNAYKGSYSKSTLKKNYADSQKQRAIELKLRKAKRNQEIFQKAYSKTKNPEYLKAVNRANRTIRIHQSNMRKLIKSNSALKRDYRRENPYHLQKDLGVAYNTTPVRATFKVPDTELNDPKALKDYESKGMDFKATLKNDEREALAVYTGSDYRFMNQSMYAPKEFERKMAEFYANNPAKINDPKVKREIKKIREYVDRLHKIFARNPNNKVDKPIIVYRGTSNIIKPNSTTVIFNSFTSATNNEEVLKYFKRNKSTYKIIIPPEAQNQALFIGGGENETIIDTNAVFDIVEQDGNNYTLLLRPKHKGVKR